jgi:hypothetical protein
VSIKKYEEESNANEIQTKIKALTKEISITRLKLEREYINTPRRIVNDKRFILVEDSLIKEAYLELSSLLKAYWELNNEIQLLRKA